MSYFIKGYSAINLPPAQGSDSGLRRAQAGAAHSIAAYFSLPRTDPGIVVMPTGSGKTALISLAPFLLAAKRVLILTPSQLVRAQIAEELSTLKVLKKVGVLPDAHPGPKVIEIKERLTSKELWLVLEECDYAVATPQCVSPGIEQIAPPPHGLFDLIIMDEAHHSEAPRWADILAHFQDAKRLLFTATPFRRDKKELRGHVIYNYPLRLAHEDKIFGNLRFIPVDPTNEASHDTAIARQAEWIYRKDIKDGFKHRLMVRTDSKKRADELAEVYRSATSLNLSVVHSGHALSTIKKTLKRLADGNIDGIICVAMMGEGFDFPQLKIAAIHAPHKSLAVTLQFIGRFARTSGEKLGEAKFLAVPQDIQAETNELYKESAAWQDIVSNLSAARIEKELKIKEVTASFTTLETAPDIDVADVVLTDFRPYFHVKIYKIDGAVDLRSLPEMPTGITILKHEISEQFSSAIILMRQVTRPRWTDLQQFSRTEHDLVVIHHNEASGLLFINSSRRTLEFYKIFEEHYGKGTAALLSGPRINRVIAGLQNPDFFSVGLKNTVQNSNTESYQIRTGPSAQNGISPTDGLLWQRGHLFGRGVNDAGNPITIGYSSSSKVWSNCTARISELIEWCQGIAAKLQTKGPVVTGTPLDSLAVGEELDALPYGIIGAGWASNVYKEFPRISVSYKERQFESQLLDIDLDIDRSACTEDSWTVLVSHPRIPSSTKLSFRIDGGRPTFAWVDQPFAISVIRDDEEVELLEYLKHYPLAFYLEDFSRVDGATIHYDRSARLAKLNEEQLAQLAWLDSNIDIQKEFPSGHLDFDAPKTIHEFLGSNLMHSDADIVFYDHGTGEMADFVTLKQAYTSAIIVRLYHCKKSGGAAPGDRVDDAYEVCGQVVKSLVWLKKKQSLRARIVERESTQHSSSVYLKGSRSDMLRILADDSPARLDIEIFVVQPGISISQISDKLGNILGAASDYLKRSSSAKMWLLGSP